MADDKNSGLRLKACARRGHKQGKSDLALEWNGKLLAQDVSMLCLVLAVCSCDWVPAILFSRPFCSLRRWNSDGEIESIRPSSAELPQWPRHMFFAEAEQGHRDVDGVDGNKDLPRSRCSANTCGYRELRLSTAVQDLCKEGIVLIKSVEKDLYLAIAEARKEEVLKEISPRQHGQLWLDLLRLMMYAYPDPYTESFEFRLRQCCRGLIASTILPFLSIVEWQDLQSGNLTLRQVGYHVILCYGGPNIECRSNFQRLVDFLLYRSTVEDQRSDSWIYLRSEIVEKLKLDERLGETTRHEIGLLQCKELLARDNLDRTGSRPKSSWRLDRRWLATPRLRGIICIMINSHMAFHREGAFIKAFREIVPHILRNKSYSLSTFEKCADVLNSPHDSQEQITKLGVSEFDVQIWFAIASELMGRARFSEANMLWHSIVEQLDFRHDHSACEYLPAVIELIKCCNYLSREAEGEAIASKVLALSADSWNEENLCNLNIVLVDSLIGSKKYGRAEEVLLTALQSGRMPSYIRNIANLRLNKMKRQLGTLTTLESFTSLTEIETDVLDPSTTNAIRYEYLEELSATLSCSDVLQALATSKSSVKAIQKLLNHPNASKDHILLTEIAVYVKGTIRGGFCEEVDQTTERIIQRDSTDSPHGLRPVARQPLNEWNRQAVIAFEGGCVRNFGSLLILQALMKKIKDEEKRLDTLELNTGITASSLAPSHNRPTVSNIESPTLDVANAGLRNLSGVERRADSTPYLPCHYFDYVAGNSTGGLIAIMLSRLRMTVDDCITEYNTLCEKVFDTWRPFSPGFAPRGSYNYKVLETVVREMIARNNQYIEGTAPGFPSDGDLCKTLVLVSKEIEKPRVPYLFRTYNNFPPDPYEIVNEDHGLPGGVHLWQVARATFTIPTYFPPIKIKLYTDDGSKKELRFNDGSGVCNNPSLEIYQDIVKRYGTSSKSVGLFISIGAGSFPAGSSSFVLGSSSTFRSHQIAREATHGAMHHLSHQDQFPYYRFDGGELLSEIPNPKEHGYHSTFMTYVKTGKAVAAYLHRSDVQHNLDECAKLLVRRRRLRTRDPSAWDRYAWASFYLCSYQGCQGQKTRFNTAELYKDHVMQMHSSALAGKPLEQAMKESRRCWEYPSRSTLKVES